MASLLLPVLAAASLAGAGNVATSATRSAEAIPSDHMQAAAALPAAPSRTANRLAGPSGSASADLSSKGACEQGHGWWDARKSTCRKAHGWGWQQSAGIVIAAGTLAGAIDAIASKQSSGLVTPSQPPVSN